MSGIQMHVPIIGKINAITLNWPPDGAGGLTTVGGTHAINGGTGTLDVTNTAGGSAYTYVTAMPSNIADYEMEADCTVTDAARVVGLVGRTTFTGTTQDNGYRSDVIQSGSPSLREFRCDSTVLTPIATAVGISGYYTTGANPVTLHMKFAGSVLTMWMSASGQADTATITATDATYANGRVALLSFLGGGGGINTWTALRVSWT